MTSERLPEPALDGDPTRRAVLRGVVAAGALGVAGVGLAACGGDEETDTGAGGTTTGAPETSAPAGGGSGGGLAKTGDIPVGGGKVFSTEKVVVTQPRQGTFAAFTAVCTHQGCTVNEVGGGTINCPCHGSRYAIADGSVANGPATKGLAAKQVKVEGDDIIVS
jgi:nitrite reductase/ring-hydroxylating ferredoxin subunit